MSNSTTTDPTRCYTEVTITRADRLALRDQVLLNNFDGTVKVCTVTALQLINDDVEVEFGTGNGSLLTSVGNTFMVVAAVEG